MRVHNLYKELGETNKKQFNTEDQFNGNLNNTYAHRHNSIYEFNRK